MNNIIVGQGPVGLIAAITLSSQGKATLIGPKANRISSMALAIHPKNMQFLRSIGIKPPAQPVHKTTLDFETPTTFNTKKPLCYIIRYNDLLQQALKKLDNIEICPTKPIELSVNTLHLPNQDIPFDRLIACDGQQSWIRNKVGIEIDTYPYNQYAHTAIVTHTTPQQGIQQYFREFGTLARLTLPNPYQSAIIWSCNVETHNAILLDGLKPHLSDHFLDILLIEHHHHIPLNASLAKTYQKDNIFLAGNSLHCIHPLAGIGFNLALGDIQVLASLIASNNTDLYTSKRKHAHTKAHWLTHQVASSRHSSNYYPAINYLAKKILGLNIVKKYILEQLNSIC